MRSSIVEVEEQRRVYRIDAGSNPAAGPIVACLLRLINHRLVQSVALASSTLADCSGDSTLSHKNSFLMFKHCTVQIGRCLCYVKGGDRIDRTSKEIC